MFPVWLQAGCWGLVAGSALRKELRHNLLTYLRAIVPVSASDLINTTVDEISKKSSGGKLSFGLLTSLWFASSGMGAIIEGLNVAYDVKETRAWWRRTLLAIVLTIALAVLIITALALMFVVLLDWGDDSYRRRGQLHH